MFLLEDPGENPCPGLFQLLRAPASLGSWPLLKTYLLLSWNLPGDCRQLCPLGSSCFPGSNHLGDEAVCGVCPVTSVGTWGGKVLLATPPGPQSPTHVTAIAVLCRPASWKTHPGTLPPQRSWGSVCLPHSRSRRRPGLKVRARGVALGTPDTCGRRSAGRTCGSQVRTALSCCLSWWIHCIHNLWV